MLVTFAAPVMQKKSGDAIVLGSVTAVGDGLFW